jgi:hypothetical protein
MKPSLILKWLRINFSFFIPAFCLTWVLIFFFPDFMLRMFGQWARLMQAVGAKNVSDFTSLSVMFTHILFMNSVTVITFFMIGLFLQAPPVMLFAGMFYSSIAFLAPFTIGRHFNSNDWLLISMEVFMLTLGISLSSALAGDLFGVEPNVGSLWKYWKHNWKNILPAPAGNWKGVLREWSGTAFIALLIIAALFVVVAWFETYGY